MEIRLTGHARRRAARRRIPIGLIEEVYRDPDETRPSETAPDREIRSRRYDGQVLEIVVDLADGSVVSVWMTRVR